MSRLKKWLEKATPAERDWLAKKAKTSVAYLRQLASGHRTASAKTAGDIETATEEKARTTKLPLVPRGDLSPACKTCPYYKKCPLK